MNLQDLPKLIEDYSKKHNLGYLCHLVIYGDGSGDICNLIEHIDGFDTTNIVDSFKSIDELIIKLNK